MAMAGAYGYDAILVLGCGINRAGQLSSDGYASVKLAEDIYRQNVAPRVIMSGSVSYGSDFTPPVAEAQAMKDYARQLGMPASAILVESESKDTLGNAYFTKANLLEPLALRRLAVVQGPNHSLARLQYIFDKVLGPTYPYALLGQNKIRPGEQERERKSLAVLRTWLDGIADGDQDSIYAIMRGKHPAYSSEPSASRNFQRLIEQA
jgi:uncharacterized SAM-binding protein YcdF (DUF218 family)